MSHLAGRRLHLHISANNLPVPLFYLSERMAEQAGPDTRAPLSHPSSHKSRRSLVMKTRLTCPHCQRSLYFSAPKVARAIQCPACSGRLLAPGEQHAMPAALPQKAAPPTMTASPAPVASAPAVEAKFD